MDPKPSPIFDRCLGAFLIAVGVAAMLLQAWLPQ